MTVKEILATTQACHALGVDGLHLHLRDQEGTHLLDATAYAEALNSGADMVPASVRELCRDDHDVTRSFYNDCAQRRIAVQHILYDVEDAELLTRILDDTLLTSPDLQLIFVLGLYAVDQKSNPSDLDPFLAWLTSSGLPPDWAVCAFGQNETPTLIRAVQAGGKCRIGFENSRQHAEGSMAKDNAARVAELIKVCAEHV